MYTLIFDIGKTNKKCFVFDEQLEVVYSDAITFAEIEDDDGFPCDDLEALTRWVRTQFAALTDRYPIQNINFSTYGASFVHIGAEDKPLLPLFNYLKPLPEEVERAFLQNYGSKMRFSLETASPYLGMLNSGLQLYWLKHTYPEVYKKIKYSLHFPQYLSFLFSGQACSDYTSLGCHTGLWTFHTGQYAGWVSKEGLDKILAPVRPTTDVLSSGGYAIGAGIHDSSAALVPYLVGSEGRFVLLSTGTWSIALNPFNEAPLSEEDLLHDTLLFMDIYGRPVKASRLFLGKEHDEQVARLTRRFKVSGEAYKSVSFDLGFYMKWRSRGVMPTFEYLNGGPDDSDDYKKCSTFEEAYHLLMYGLVRVQLEALSRCIGDTKEITRIFVDGGFANNVLFVRMLALELQPIEVITSQLAGGSALGAALVMDTSRFDNVRFHTNLNLKKIPV